MKIFIGLSVVVIGMLLWVNLLDRVYADPYDDAVSLNRCMDEKERLRMTYDACNADLAWSQQRLFDCRCKGTQR